MRKNIIRRGDYVKVVKPTVVIRCGLPKTTLDYRDWALKQYEKMDLVGDEVKITEYWKLCPPDETLIRYLARYKGYMEHFGGRDRSLHTAEAPDLVGATGYVWDIKTVYTGYCHSSYTSGPDYWTGETDYEPGGLEDKKGHRIAWVCFDQYMDNFFLNIKNEPHFKEYWRGFSLQGAPIEVVNLEKTGGCKDLSNTCLLRRN